jgi:hypothetical protein
MSEISNLFVNHLMTSGVESGYWARLLREQMGLDERDRLRRRLASPRGGALRPWWRWRERRLTRSLRKLGRQVDQLEAMLDPAEPLKARLPAAKRA